MKKLTAAPCGRRVGTNGIESILGLQTLAGIQAVGLTVPVQTVMTVLTVHFGDTAPLLRHHWQ